MDDSISSQDLAGAGFAPHGEFRLRFADGILYALNRGPFNAEAMRLYGRLRQAAFERWQLSGRWIGGIASWEGSVLMSPEAFDDYERGLAAFLRTEHRLVGVAWVAEPELEGMAFMQERFARLFRATEMPFQLFGQMAAAQAWLQPQVDAWQRAARPSA